MLHTPDLPRPRPPLCDRVPGFITGLDLPRDSILVSKPIISRYSVLRTCPIGQRHCLSCHLPGDEGTREGEEETKLSQYCTYIPREQITMQSLETMTTTTTMTEEEAISCILFSNIMCNLKPTFCFVLFAKFTTILLLRGYIPIAHGLHRLRGRRQEALS